MPVQSSTARRHTAIPDWELVTIPNAGHLSNVDQAKRSKPRFGASSRSWGARRRTLSKHRARSTVEWPGLRGAEYELERLRPGAPCLARGVVLEESGAAPA